MAYQKTNWKNFPSTETPVYADNLNNIEKGIETNDTNKLAKSSVKTTQTSSNTDTYSCNYIDTLKGDVLYESGGSSDTFTLTKSASGYKYIEVFFLSDNCRNSTKFVYSDGVKFSTTNIYPSDDGNKEYVYTTSWILNGANCTRVATRNNVLNEDNTLSSYGSNPFIIIYKIIGYK